METGKDNDSWISAEGGQEHSLGSYLKKMREEQGISLGAISKNTKIPVSNLELLETDAFDKLPDKIYIIGYVKSYSKAIGITPDAGLHLLTKFYNDEHSYRRFAPGGVPKERTWEVFKEKNPKKINKRPIYGILILVLGILFVVSGKYLSRYQKEEEQTIAVINHKSINAETPLKNKSQISLKPEPLRKTEELSPSSKPSPQNSEFSSQENAAISEKKTIDPPTSSQTNENNEEDKKKEVKEKTITKKTFLRMTRPLYSIDQSIDEQKILESIPESIRKRTVLGKQNIYIRAVNEDSWMAYKSDNKPVKRFILKKGDDTFLKGEEIRLFLGNYRGLQIFLNNQLLNITSRTRHKSLVFPQENRKKYLTPLFIYHDSGKVETSTEYIKRTELEEQNAQL